MGLDTCAELIAEIGLTRTVIVGDLATMIDLMATDAGFTDVATRELTGGSVLLLEGTRA